MMQINYSACTITHALCMQIPMHTVHLLWTKIFSDPTSDLWDTRRMVSIWIAVSHQAAIPKGSAVKMTEKKAQKFAYWMYSLTARENEDRGLFWRKKLSFTKDRSWDDLEYNALGGHWAKHVGVCCEACCTAHWRWSTIQRSTEGWLAGLDLGVDCLV